MFAARTCLSSLVWPSVWQTVFRAKYGESAFLEVYQKLYEAPDPSAVLVNAAVSPSLTLLCHAITLLVPDDPQL